MFEATMVAGLGASGRSEMLAGLLLYRLIYSVLPFLVAVIALAVSWALAQRHVGAKTSGWAGRLVRPLVPVAAAGAALLAGAIPLVSGTLPSDTARLGMLRDILPLSFIEASHLAGSVAGLLSIVISRGLYRKLYRAWVIATLMALMTRGEPVGDEMLGRKLIWCLR